MLAEGMELGQHEEDAEFLLQELKSPRSFGPSTWFCSALFLPLLEWLGWAQVWKGAAARWLWRHSILAALVPGLGSCWGG